MQDERLTISAAVVYAVMLDRAKGDAIKVTAKKLAELTGQTQRSVERAIKQLKDTGYITDTIRGQNGSTTYTIKKVVPDKKQKPETTFEPESMDTEQLEFDTPDSSGTFETDLTPEQVRHLSELIATKLSSDGRTPDRIDKLLRGEYAKMKLRARKDVGNVAAYLAKMIENWKPEPESKPYDNGVDYDSLVNDFDSIRNEMEEYEKICINNYEVI